MADTTFIAFYLPQFHQTGENDRFWGEGFTDWDMVRNARRMFPGHKQPLIPQWGYYDLCSVEIRREQGFIAKEYGLDAFCYWHYFFGDQKTVLDKPLLNMLRDKQPDIPFMLGWVNQNWTANWRGRKGNTLIEQKYGSTRDFQWHLEYLFPFFSCSNHLRIDGRLPFLIYNPLQIPEFGRMTDLWRQFIDRELGAELLFMGYQDYGPYRDHAKFIEYWLDWDYVFGSRDQFLRYGIGLARLPWPYFVSYQSLISRFNRLPVQEGHIPVVYCNWDNTPRMRKKSFIFTGFSPERFGILLQNAKRFARETKTGIVFIKSWNEWAEGNVMEPDLIHGMGALETLSKIRSCRDA